MAFGKEGASDRLRLLRQFAEPFLEVGYAMTKALLLMLISSVDLANGASVLCAWEGRISNSELSSQERLASNESNNATLKISVVDEKGNPVPNAKLNVWGVAFTPPPKPADLVDKWVALGKGETDTAGELRFSISNSEITNVQIDALDTSEMGLVGSGRSDKWNLNRGTPVKIVLVKSKKFTGRLVDYDRRSPIDSAMVQLFAQAKHRVGWIDTGRTAKSDGNGRFLFTSLNADGAYRILVSHPDYHRFDGYDLIYSFRFKQSKNERLIELLSNDSYRRVIESARLSMPKTSDLPASKAFELLSNRFDADQVFHNQIVSQDIQSLSGRNSTRRDPFHQFMVRTRLHPKDLYFDAMRKLAGSDGTTPTQYRALAWLATVPPKL